MKRIYRLYIWARSKDAYGLRVRGRCINEFDRYKDLVAEAQRRAKWAGYPKSRWMDLYDWNV